MFKKIAAVQPFTKTELIIWFADGEARLYDATQLMDERTGFDKLKDEQFFSAVKLAAEGYGVSWGNDLDLGCKEMYDNSTHIDVVDNESWRVIGEVVEARHGASLSQARLASAAGVKQPVVARLETGVNSPRLDTMLKVLTPLGKTLQVVNLRDVADADKLRALDTL
ncbi:MAG: DUF2442 domain-containing protein [Coriobacteriales bacterium]|nr:DUF2442 domain-containing protein [Coriobacteriales bacterium]